MMKKTAELGFFLAVALILSYVESLIPISIGIPGIKLGLPNAVVVLLLYDRDGISAGDTAVISAKRGIPLKTEIPAKPEMPVKPEMPAKTKMPVKTGIDRHIRRQEGYGIREAALVNALRIILSGFLFSNLYTIIYALAGAVFSMAAMLAGKKLHCFSVVGVSVLGGVFHNIGQIIVAMLVVETFAVSYYAPVLIAAGTLTGALLGLVVMELMPYLRHYRQHA